MDEAVLEARQKLSATVSVCDEKMSSVPGYRPVPDSELKTAKQLWEKSRMTTRVPPGRVSIREARVDPETQHMSAEEQYFREMERRHREPLKSNFNEHYMAELVAHTQKPLSAGMESTFNILSEDAHTVMAMFGTVDKARYYLQENLTLDTRTVLPENHQQIIAGFLQKLEQWPEDFTQTRAYLHAFSGALQDSNAYEAVKELHAAMRAQKASRENPS